jgi:hypothetical protein
MTCFLPKHHSLIAALGLLLAWHVVALAAPSTERTPAEPLALVQAQTQTIAACGQTRCDCGATNLISQQSAPCHTVASTGECSTGTGWCCVCASPRTVAICSEALCDCSNSTLLTRVSAPCTTSSSAGQCRIGSGSCCVCALE